MGTCLSKKKGSSNPSPHAGTKSVLASSTAPPQLQKNHENGVTVTLSKPETIIPPKKKNTVQEKMDPEVVKEDEEGQVKKEIFIIKHRKSHDEREKRSSKIQTCTESANGLAPPGASAATSETTTESESMGNKGVVGVRTSSCTKEEVDAILIQCGRLSRSSSGKAASSSAGGRKYSGSKRSYDFDHCDNDAISAEDDQKRVTPNASDNNSEEYDGVAAENRSRHRHNHHQHRQRNRQSPRPSSPSSSQGRRRRTPSRERDQQQQQRSSSRERRVSRSPGRRSSETNTSNSNASNNNNGSSSRPGKMVSVPPTVSSLVMDKSNNNGGGGGGGEQPAAATGIKRVTVKRSVGGDRSAASPRARSQSPHARANGNNANNQQQPSLSRNNSSRKAEHSPYRRNPLSEVDPNTLAYPQSNSTNNGSCKVQNKPKKEIEADAAIQKPNFDMNDNSRNRTSSRVALEKSVTTVSVNCHTKEVQEEEIIKDKVLSSVQPDNAVVKTMVMPHQTLTRSRSSRRSRDFDINPEALLNPPVSYTSILLEDIQNFHQKNTQPQPSSVSLPACLTKACSILEAVADLNSTNPTTSSNLSGGAFSDDNRRSPPTCQSIRNEYNVVPLKQVPDTKDPFVESEVVVSDAHLDFAAYSELVDGLCDIKHSQYAMEVFCYMSMKRCSLHSFSFYKLTKCVCDSGQVNKAIRLRQLAYYCGISCCIATHTIIMHELSKSVQAKNLLAFLSQMLIVGSNLDVEAYCILIHSMIEQNLVKECVLFFNRMVNEGLIPDPDRLFDQLSFIANHSQLSMISSAIEKISDSENLSSAIYSLLITGLWKEGKEHDARRLLDLMLKKGWLPDTTTHKLLIGYDVREGRSQAILFDDNSTSHDSVSNILAEGLGDS